MCLSCWFLKFVYIFFFVRVLFEFGGYFRYSWFRFLDFIQNKEWFKLRCSLLLRMEKLLKKRPEFAFYYTRSR